MKQIKVRLKERSYYIKIGKDITSSELKISNNFDYAIVSHPTLKNIISKIALLLKKNNIRFSKILISEGEKSKSLDTYLYIVNKLFQFEKQKKLCLVAVGGGVVGDVVGFVASTYKRGIPYIQIPTTLLSSVDSAIGGKTAIDTPQGKNLIGSFYQPLQVIIDISNLKTLPKREIISGMAEVIKYGIIKSPNLFEYLEKNYEKILSYDENTIEKVIFECCKIKAKLVEEDERDTKDKRIILNCGHTIAHAIEASIEYSNLYNHGESVGLGLLIESKISNMLGYISEKDIKRIKSLLANLELPIELNKNISLKKILQAMQFDKKFISGKNRFVLPVRIGLVKVVEGVPQEIIEKAIIKFKG